MNTTIEVNEGFFTKENSSSEPDLSVQIIRVKTDGKIQGYLVISGTELEDISSLIRKLNIYSKFILAALAIALASALTCLAFGYEIALATGLGAIALGLLLESKANMNLTKKLQIVAQECYKGSLPGVNEEENKGFATEIYVFYSDEKSLEKAESLLKKAIRGKLDLQDCLVMDVKHILFWTFPSRILLLLGLITIATKYLFVSILHFIFLGIGILLVLLDTLGVALGIGELY